MRLKTSDNDPEQVWESTTGFHGRLTPPLTRWQELAQVLLMSNEFAFWIRTVALERPLTVTHTCHILSTSITWR